jgi:uncharacterized protein (TIGR02172 family)
MEKGTLIGTGRTAEVYAWGDERILKLYQDWMPDISIEWEFAITRRAREAGLPVPAAEEIVRVDRRSGIVFERIHGISMLADLQARPGAILSLSRLLAELHARMHACSLPPDTNSQRKQIERGIEFGKGLSEPEKQTILGILARLPEGNVVCHGDFHPDNVLMTEHGPVIIDWMNGTRGHPLGDVARTALLFQTGGLPPGMSFTMRLMINASRRLIHSTYMKRYLQLHPAPWSEIEAWKLPIYAARLSELESYPAEKTLILRRIRSGLAKMDKRAI